jgi:hypothetical protein
MRTILAWFVVMAWAFPSVAAAKPEARPGPAIPEALRPWVPWVLAGDEGKPARCPTLGDKDELSCLWPSRLELRLDGRGGSFSQEWLAYAEGQVTLPGDKEHWPLDVRLDAKPAQVTDDGDAPKAMLSAGRHVLQGRFTWDSLPESLQIPTTTGLVALAINGKPIDFPQRDAEGRLFLGKKAAEADQADTVDVSVHRKLIDETPLQLTTRLVLAVSGRSRELLLARALPADFEPQSVDSGLPLRFESDGRLRIQARPGSWTITLLARRVKAEKSITRPKPDGLWKEGEEAWVFEARPELRVVNIEGVVAIDPAQTTLPDEWKKFPAYAVAPGAILILAEQRRGDAQPAPDRLSLTRELWLDYDGGGYSVRDTIAAQINQAWRLEMDPGTHLGQVKVNQQPQFITRLGQSGREGVELRAGSTQIEAHSRIESTRSSIPAVSFGHDFQSASAQLNVPPGWRLLYASGVDGSSGTWIERWTLMDLFILMLVAIVVGRLYGVWAGVLAGFALALTLVEYDAPRTIWFAVIICEALVRALRGGWLLTLVRLVRTGVWIAVVAIVLPFAMYQVRKGMHPGYDQSASELEMGELVKYKLLDASKGPTDRYAQLVVKAKPAARGVEGKAGLHLLKGPKDDVDQELEGLIRSGAGGLGTPPEGQARMAQNLAQYDPSMELQTGQGLPKTGAYSVATLSFNGPVSRGQVMHVYLVPPWLNGVLAFLRVGLLAALAWLLLRRPLRLTGAWMARQPLLTGLAVLVLLAFPATSRAADFPSKELLEDLKTQLLEKPECAPDCSAINDLLVEAVPGELRLRLKVSAAARTSLPLPGDASSWQPHTVRVDGKPAVALARGDAGTLWLAVEPGTFTVELVGSLPSRETVQIPLPGKPRHASAHARGYVVTGIHEDGAVDESITLTREDRNAGESRDENAAPVLPPFLRVERTLMLGLKWEVHTRVARESPTGAPVAIEIPLLAGESVTTPGIRIEKARGVASLSLGPNDSVVTWQSTLSETPVIHLRAAPEGANRWFETWRVQVGPTWHPTFTGIPPIHRTQNTEMREPEWRPWPGEEVHIALEKPKGVAGQTLTIDASTLEVSPGLRSSHVQLSLDLRASRGMQHRLTLPPDAEIESVVDGAAQQPIRKEAGKLVLDVSPGQHTFRIGWRQPLGLGVFFHGPKVDLGLPSANSHITFSLASAPRWILWLGGPRLGPAVHVWSVLVVLLLAGWALARVRLTPLRVRDWVLLGLGLLQLDTGWALVMPLFLLALGWRSQRPPQSRAWLYDLGQLVLVGLTIAALAVLAEAVRVGLLRAPNMHIMGNDSHASMLRWYQDRAAAILPEPFMFSLPILVYRLAMLAWALWLALSCVRWAGWAWSSFKQHDLWQPLRRKVTPKQP